MLKKTIKYSDYNGVEREEPFYFNLSKAEVAEMNLSTTGGYIEMINQIIEAKDTASLVKAFKELLLKAYGERSVDGKYFIKIDENGRPLCNKFMQTEAYSELFMELSQNTESAIEFVNGIMPKAD